MKRALSTLFLLTGFFFFIFGFYLVYLRQSPKILSFNGRLEEKAPVTGNIKPLKIRISQIELELPVTAAISDGKNWETSNKGVSYLANSPLPGNKGNSIMYGHNWESLLRKLPLVKPGQIIEITMNNGEKREFIIEYTATVSPNQIYVIENTSDTRLTLYTCTGFLDSKRFVVVAKPQQI